MRKGIRTLGLTVSVMALAAGSETVHAQAETKDGNDTAVVSTEDIVVTARKRDESLASVPVTVTAVTGAVLATRGVVNLEGFARTVPQLFIANSSGGFQGGAIGLRGISAGDGNVFGDQAVAFNIDGVLIARASPRRLSQFDMQQIEVLKGPQALFYGKNSPGGVIAIRSADPGDTLEANARLTYEFNAREWRAEAAVGGPVADGLGVRAALLASDMDGWVKNIATPGTPYSPNRKRLPRSHEFSGRVTVKLDRGGPFNARLKLTYGNQRDDGQFNNVQRVYCPLGAPQLGGPDDCTPDNRAVHATLGTKVGTGGTNTVTGAPIAGVPLYGDGSTFSRTRQYLAGLEMNYALGDRFSLASNSGYYDVSIRLRDVANAADPTAAFNRAAGPAAVSGMLVAAAELSIREISQELRLTSDLDGRFNFMLGAYYQGQKVDYINANTVNVLNPVQINPPVTITQRGTAWSPFGSVSLKPIDTIEISGGLRYSHEKKKIGFFRLLPGTLPASQGGASYAAGERVPTTVSSRSFSNVSPEAVVTWRPNGNATLYAGWKRGFLSGGFNAAGPNTGAALIPDASYDQQIVQGFEGGVKLALLDRSLRLNLAAYSYDIKGLQVASVIPGPPIRQVVSNAASATSRGVEADLNWTTPVDGLSLRGAAAYNDAHYKGYDTAACYAGQTIAMGCNLGLSAGVYTRQDLAGEPLVRAPRWAGSVGGTYALDLGGGDRLTLSTDLNVMSRFYTEGLGNPASIQRGYALIDGSLSWTMRNGLTIAFVGRNLTNRYYFQRSSTAPFTGGPSGVASSFQGDQIAYVSRGRELAVQAGFKF